MLSNKFFDELVRVFGWIEDIKRSRDDELATLERLERDIVQLRTIYKEDVDLGLSLKSSRRD